MTDPSSFLSLLDQLRVAREADEERFGDDLPYAHSVDDDMEEQDEPIPFDDLDDL